MIKQQKYVLDKNYKNNDLKKCSDGLVETKKREIRQKMHGRFSQLIQEIKKQEAKMNEEIDQYFTEASENIQRILNVESSLDE